MFRKRPNLTMRLSSGHLFVLPFFVLLLGFGAFPFLFSLFLSFHSWDPVSGDGIMRFRGLAPYGLVFTDPAFWAALGHSLIGGLPGVIALHLVALPLAFALHLVFRPWAGTLGLLFFLPYLAAPVALSAALGLLSSILTLPLEDLLGWLRGLGLEFVPSSLSGGGTLEAFGTVWRSLGLVLLLYLLALGAVPRSLLEAAQLDGAGFWRQLCSVAFPLLRPMVFVAFGMTLVSGMQSGAWRMDYGRLEDLNLPGYILKTAFHYTNFGLSSTMTWVFFGVMLMLLGTAYGLFGRGFTALGSMASLESDHAPMRLPLVPTVLLKLFVSVSVLFCLYPLLLLFCQATQSGGGSLELRIGDSGAVNYALLLEALPQFWRTLWNSVYISSLAALAATVTSALAGYAFATLEFRGKTLLFGVVLLTLAFPVISSAIPLLMQMRILNWIDLPRSLWVPAASSALGVFLVRQFALGTVQRSMLEAARVDGASEGRIFVGVALPNLWPALLTVGLLSFVTTFSHVESAILLLRSELTRTLPLALGFLGSGERALFGAALGTLPPLLVFLLASGAIKRSFGLGRARDGAPTQGGLGRLWGLRLDHRSSPPQQHALPGADAVRAIACLLVVFSHLAQRLEKPAQTDWVQEVQAFSMTGAYGVSAFFVLSGMLLSLPFWRRYLDGKGPPDLLEYTRRRFLRIAPGFYVSLGVSFLIARALAPGDFALERLLAGLTFTSAVHPVTFFPVELNGPLWSIGFEVACYALMPLFMLGLFAGVSRTRRDRPFGLALAYWLGVLALAVGVHFWLLRHAPSPAEGRGWEHGLIGGAKVWMPHYNAIGLFAQYSVGVLAAGLIALRQRLGKDPPGPARANRHDLAVAFGILGTCGLLWVQRDAPEFSLSLGAQPYAFPLFALCVALILSSAPFSRWAGPRIDHPALRFTARISFGLYIWHYLVLELVRLFHDSAYRYFGLSSLPHWAVLSAVALALSYAVAQLSYTHIEAPFLRGLARGRETVGAKLKRSLESPTEVGEMLEHGVRK